MRPNFIVIGAAKSATTSLCSILGDHPEVFMCDPKEPDFFSVDRKYRRGIDWYESLFAGAQGAKAIGEGSTTYTFNIKHPEAPARIAKHLPDAKLIYIVRHPMDRIRSHWLQVIHNGWTMPIPLAQALEEIPELIDASRYWKQISLYHRHYPNDRILVLFFEEFKADPHAVLRRCFEFLGVDPDFVPERIHQPRNATADHLEDTRALWLLRKVPGLIPFGMKTPKSFRTFLKQRLRRPLKAPDGWDQESWDHVRKQIQPDIEQFLSFYGKPKDYWNLVELRT